ncbi:MAG TPA: pyridoxamine 5'-phosphate oxidase family protein [Deltaproteobacteria bacterium]|nr:pyridoxamine 5'-phosphate oxidase family protein [Deltaproteobacteria bacterium]HOM28360.1 pyridoxamine 5'-phosphate oxidase family protein [Deltaproteobacteria bacterium]HPP80030.1 pyridoxamine 5'-phosphate oxidase family protein [Deltaproteobacteria bacterium]
MKLSEYFEQARGKGVLATADSSGQVNAALYAKPHFIDESTVAFILAPRLTHGNLETNPYAAYIFIEDGEGFKGRRLYLTKIKEEKNSELIATLRRKKRSVSHDEAIDEDRFLVFFRIDRVLPLVGSGA